MKIKKTYNVFQKIRAALRDIWRYSPSHREAIKRVMTKSVVVGNCFHCPICNQSWPIQMSSVDHQPPCGSLLSWEDLTPFAKQLFEGPTRVICKICHRKITAQQRKRTKNG